MSVLKLGVWWFRVITLEGGGGLVKLVLSIVTNLLVVIVRAFDPPWLRWAMVFWLSYNALWIHYSMWDIFYCCSFFVLCLFIAAICCRRCQSSDGPALQVVAEFCARFVEGLLLSTTSRLLFPSSTGAARLLF